MHLFKSYYSEGSEHISTLRFQLNGSLKMIYLIHGENIIQARNIFQNIKKKYQGNFIEKEVNHDFRLTDFISLCRTKPLFLESGQLIILNAEDTKPVLVDEFYEFIRGRLDESDILLYFNKKLSSSSKMLKALSSRSDTKVFLVKQSKESQVFKLLDLITLRLKREALLELNRLLTSGSEPLFVLSMIAYQLRNLSLVKFKAESKNSLHPFVLKKVSRGVSNFSGEELIFSYNKVLEAEVLIKSGGDSSNFILENLVINLCNP